MTGNFYSGILGAASVRVHETALAFPGALRIAAFSPDAVSMAKQAVDAGTQPFVEGLLEEAYLFEQSRGSREGVRQMKQFLGGGGQTRSREMSLEWFLHLSEEGQTSRQERKDF